MSVRGDLPAPAEALFPASSARAHVDDWLTRELANAIDRVNRGSVMPTLNMQRFRLELARFDFETPQEAQPLLEWVIAQLEHGVVHMTHPRYFGLFNPSPNFPSQCADRIAGAFNPQLASSGSSPAPVEIEAHVIRAFAHRAGYPEDSGGHFTSGGSEANFTSMVCALTRAEPRFGTDGVRAFDAPVAVYVSRECHPVWSKICHQTGIGRTALRPIATDGSGRMDCDQLSDEISRDRRRGTVPIMICATAGTTSGGMIDPLDRCAAIARVSGLWYHVDAAWGGAALCSDRLRGLLTGIELADSITVDAHKWLATTMGCGMFITKHAGILQESFRVATDFMPSNASSIDPYLNSVQWSRRFCGLKLFLSLGVAGWRGYGTHADRSVAVVGCVKERLLARGWRVVNNSPLAVLCVVPPANSSSIRDIVTRVLGLGRAWISRATFEGSEVIRICATHGETTLADVDELVNGLIAVG